MLAAHNNFVATGFVRQRSCLCFCPEPFMMGEGSLTWVGTSLAQMAPKELPNYSLYA
ncbi:hypothetical protein [Polaromonas sp. UBA4122]|uniref:hypothetical protein n=1 Tax=Polaromonas sp. UBA4122 TaxID=1947074 RepID=UPI0025E75FB8|nr:hypothetical protein [Polaromonas sp. UBA4122]